MAINVPLNGLSQKLNSTQTEKKLFTGGNFGLQFGTFTNINISPWIGLNISAKIKSGVGVSYIYIRNNQPSLRYEAITYGGRMFFQYYFNNSIFSHAEYEVLNGNYFINEPRRNIISLFVGGGLNQVIGKNSNINLMLLYNLNDNIYSPYSSNPIIRVGYMHNFFSSK